ncbi:DUF2255 family protein [Herbiconiux daphne]|uniref:DUF2255 family protein n=1 Tax=Herbiconiux daphne TaxID=2970914 RepID=A0ABT2H567_9MICO|nr:DUF2255 family protein [Herbiconiux daphne]MCS5735082.1 DUF2255 family protein [Herbiconiux daphne]
MKVVNDWSPAELAHLESVEELQISPLSLDGTQSRAVTIWVLRDGSDVYVRSSFGQRSNWYRRVLASQRAHVATGPVDRDVDVRHVDDEASIALVNRLIESKYGRYGPTYLDTQNGTAAMAATLRLTPA